MHQSIGLPARPVLAALTLACSLGIVACSTGEKEAAGESGARRGGQAGFGSATLEVGGGTYEFDRVRCAVGPEETQRDDTEFVLSAIQNGLQLDATINTRFGHSVTLDDIQNRDNPRTGWSAGELDGIGKGAGEVIQVDGKEVSATATFTNSLTGAAEEGTLTAVCPG